MAEFQFVSPGVKFNIIDQTNTSSSSLGLTSLGLVSETVKGPAFQPIFIQNLTQFVTRFGPQSNERLGSNLKFLGSYYANSYLSQSNNLTFTRILGLEGYPISRGYGIKLSAGVNSATTGVSSTSIVTGATFSASTFSGQTIIAQTGITQTIPATFVKNSTYGFTGTTVRYIITSLSYVNGVGYSGLTNYTAQTVTGTSLSTYEDVIVAVVRSRGSYSSNVLTYASTGVSITLTGASTNILGNFILTSTGSTGSIESYTCNLDNTSSSFISKVIGSNEKDKNAQIFVEAVYPDLISKLQSDGSIYGLRAELVGLDNTYKANYSVGYQTPETPFVVSELRGSSLTRLFQFVSISDGDSANQEIKITIQNINPATNEFDVLIRDFNDTDANIIILESYSRCNLDKTSNSFIGNRIGDNGLNYSNISNYVYIVWDDFENLPSDAFPAGFEGYSLRSYSSGLVDAGVTGKTAPILYKTSYASTDKVLRTYLGISERAFDTTLSVGTGINQNMYNFQGSLSASGLTKTNGFHLDSGATGTYTNGSVTIGQFTTGPDAIRTDADVANPSNAYYNIKTRKFTFVPYGGFDGWNIFRDSRSLTNQYKTGGIYASTTSDWNAYLMGIQTFQNPEETNINLFSTAGINWSDNEALVNEAIDMIETSRADSLYVIDAPDLDDTSSYAQDISDLMSTTSIDSFYSATYGPWIQFPDTTNNVNVYIPPTGEVLKNMAITDNVRFPWFAPAGLGRGIINAKRARRKLSSGDRDTLYSNRINPIATFSEVGVTIFGQKTLQIKQTSLDRINVVRLILYIRKLLSNISITLLFDQNDDIVIQQFLNSANPVLANIQKERGISNFRFEYQSINTPETRDRNQLFFNLYITPIAALEEIGINLIVTPTGALFSTQ